MLSFATNIFNTAKTYFTTVVQPTVAQGLPSVTSRVSDAFESVRPYAPYIAPVVAVTLMARAWYNYGYRYVEEAKAQSFAEGQRSAPQNERPATTSQSVQTDLNAAATSPTEETVRQRVANDSSQWNQDTLNSLLKTAGRRLKALLQGEKDRSQAALSKEQEASKVFAGNARAAHARNDQLVQQIQGLTTQFAQLTTRNKDLTDALKRQQILTTGLSLRPQASDTNQRRHAPSIDPLHIQLQTHNAMLQTQLDLARKELQTVHSRVLLGPRTVLPTVPLLASQQSQMLGL